MGCRDCIHTAKSKMSTNSGFEREELVNTAVWKLNVACGPDDETRKIMVYLEYALVAGTCRRTVSVKYGIDHTNSRLTMLNVKHSVITNGRDNLLYKKNFVNLYEFTKKIWNVYFLTHIPVDIELAAPIVSTVLVENRALLEEVQICVNEMYNELVFANDVLDNHFRIASQR